MILRILQILLYNFYNLISHNNKTNKKIVNVGNIAWVKKVVVESVKILKLNQFQLLIPLKFKWGRMIL